jgi:hypothetical protein
VASGQRGVAGSHWEKLVALMPLYRALSTVCLGDGKKVSFWRDVWHGDAALCRSAPALFSHSTKKEASLAYVLATGVRNTLVPCLTATGERELAAVELLLAACVLATLQTHTPSPDAASPTGTSGSPTSTNSARSAVSRPLLAPSSGVASLRRASSSSDGCLSNHGYNAARLC